MGVCDGEAVVRKWEEGNECSDSLRGNACSNGEFQRGGFRYAPAHGMREAGALIHSPLASLAVVGRLACALDTRIMPHAGH
jgi:hypothetical protein